MMQKHTVIDENSHKQELYSKIEHLEADNAALRLKVQELEDWKRIVTGAGTDQESVIRLAATEYTKTAVQCWRDANAQLQERLDTLETLVKALPVLDMRFDSVAVGPLGWTVGGVTFGKVTEANAYSALLQYRAAMATQDAGKVCLDCGISYAVCQSWRADGRTECCSHCLHTDPPHPTEERHE